MEEQLRQFEFQVYGQLEKNITEARQQTESAMAGSHSELGQLATIRKELESIIREVQRAAMPAGAEALEAKLRELGVDPDLLSSTD